MKKRGRQEGEIDSEVLRLLTFNSEKMPRPAALKRTAGSDVE